MKMSEKNENSKKINIKQESSGMRKSESEERMDQWLAQYFAESSDDEDVIIIESKCIPATRPLPETDCIVISD